MAVRRFRPLLRLVVRAFSAMLVVALVSGGVQSGRRLFFCAPMGTLLAHACCADAEQTDAAAISRDDESCCRVLTLEARAPASPASAPSVPPSPWRAEEQPVRLALRDLLLLPPLAAFARPGLRPSHVPKPPDPESHRIALRVSLT